jgi:hypothetical protein
MLKDKDIHYEPQLRHNKIKGCFTGVKLNVNNEINNGEFKEEDYKIKYEELLKKYNELLKKQKPKIKYTNTLQTTMNHYVKLKKMTNEIYETYLTHKKQFEEEQKEQEEPEPKIIDLLDY